MHAYKKRREANIYACMHHLCTRHQSLNNVMAIAFIIIVARRIILPDLAMATGLPEDLYSLRYCPNTFIRLGIARAAFVARDCPRTFLRSGIARATFVARGLLEDLSSLGDCPSAFLRSGIARGPFFARGLPGYLSSLEDCPSSSLRSGIARVPFSTWGFLEQLSSLRDCLSTFFGGYFLLPLDHLILLDIFCCHWIILLDCYLLVFINYESSQMVSTFAKGNFFFSHQSHGS
jgi:hypothetical protein